MKIVIPNGVRDLQFAASNPAPRFPQTPPGELKIPANFPQATAEITKFEDVKKAAHVCVERTLLSAAFDFDFWQPGSPLLAFCARGGIPPALHKQQKKVILSGVAASRSEAAT